MIITQEEIVNCQTVLLIELEAGDLDPYLNTGYKKIAQRMAIPGFRKGKAPRAVVERFMGREGLLTEVLNSTPIIPEITDRAIAEQDINPAGRPEVELLEIDPVKLKATVPLEPNMDLGSYQSIRVAETSVELSIDAVDSAMEQLQQSVGTWEPVNRPVKMGDTVTVNAEGKIADRTLVNEQDAVFFLDEKNDLPVPGFADNLVDIQSGESKEFKLKIPDDHQVDWAAGQEASFLVSVNEVKERIIPELDDEFAKSYEAGYENLGELRKKIEKDLNNEAEQKSLSDYKELAIQALLDGTTIELPPIMVEHEITHMEQERERVLQRINVRTDDYLKSIGKTAEEMRNEMNEAAVGQLKRSFVLTKIAELEKLEVSDEEVENRIQTLLKESSEPSDDQQITDQMKESIRRMLLGEKTVDRIVSIAQGDVNEVMKTKSEVSEPLDDKPEQDEE